MRTTGKKAITRVLSLTYALCTDTYTNNIEHLEKNLDTHFFGHVVSENIFTYWMQTDRATPERLQFIHRETTGSNRLCGHRLSLSFFRHRDGYMAFNTSLNLCIIEEIDEAEEPDHDDEANYLDLLIGDEMVQYHNSTNAFTTV